MSQSAIQAASSAETKWKPYPAYKDSGVEWLGKIPAHWKVKRLKHLCLQSAVYGANEPSGSYLDAGVRFLRTTDINDNGALASDGAVFLEEALMREYLLKDGELLLSRSGTIGRSFLYDSRIHGQCAYAGYLVKFSPNPENSPRFLFYLTKSWVFLDWLGASIIQSTIGNVNGQKYANMPVASPSFKEQEAIVNFLNRETTKIDALIAKKERLIELLEEKRTALISHAVTKGLNPNTPMKDSGTEWLGEIPKHWDIQKLKHVARVSLSSVDKKFEEGESAVRLCNYVDVYYNDYITPSLNFMNATASREEMCKFSLKAGDVLVTKDSEEWSDIAVPAYVPQKLPSVICGYHLAYIRPNPRAIDGQFLFRAFSARGINDQFRVEANGITRYGLGKDSLDTGYFPIPPIEEQRAIVDFINRETAKIDALVAKIRQHIEKLREYRTALISAAVTGKIDLRSETST